MNDEEDYFEVDLPKKAEKPTPRKAEKPAPRKAEKPAVKKVEKPAPKKVEKPAPDKPAKPTPKKTVVQPVKKSQEPPKVTEPIVIEKVTPPAPSLIQEEPVPKSQIIESPLQKHEVASHVKDGVFAAVMSVPFDVCLEKLSMHEYCRERICPEFFVIDNLAIKLFGCNGDNLLLSVTGTITEKTVQNYVVDATVVSPTKIANQEFVIPCQVFLAKAGKKIYIDALPIFRDASYAAVTKLLDDWDKPGTFSSDDVINMLEDYCGQLDPVRQIFALLAKHSDDRLFVFIEKEKVTSWLAQHRPWTEDRTSNN